MGKNVHIDYVDVLLLIFIVLKFTGLINWSWWWVLSPMWISLLLLMAIAVVVKILN